MHQALRVHAAPRVSEQAHLPLVFGGALHAADQSLNLPRGQVRVVVAGHDGGRAQNQGAAIARGRDTYVVIGDRRPGEIDHQREVGVGVVAAHHRDLLERGAPEVGGEHGADALAQPQDDRLVARLVAEEHEVLVPLPPLGLRGHVQRPLDQPRRRRVQREDNRLQPLPEAVPQHGDRHRLKLRHDVGLVVERYEHVAPGGQPVHRVVRRLRSPMRSGRR